MVSAYRKLYKGGTQNKVTGFIFLPTQLAYINSNQQRIFNNHIPYIPLCSAQNRQDFGKIREQTWAVNRDDDVHD